jgi:sugar phosphate isomerase/epimerase
MRRRYALAPLTLIELAPPDLLSAAAQSGYDAVGLRLSAFRAGEAQHPMLLVEGRKPAMLRDTEQRLRDSDLQVLDIEVMLLTPNRDVQDFAPVFEVGSLLGARHALTLAEISEEARYERLVPGQGGLALQAFLQALPDGIPLGLEVPMRRLSQTVSAVDRAARALRAAKEVVGQGLGAASSR